MANRGRGHERLCTDALCLAVVNELVSSLPLQMLLYFNMFYFPCWWFSAVFMLEAKVGLVLAQKYNSSPQI